MPLTQKHRPPHLDTAASHTLAIARIVSPVASLLMSEDMRNTFRISQSIRQQQTDLIAAAQERVASERNKGDENGKEGDEKERDDDGKEHDDKYEIDDNLDEEGGNASVHSDSGNGASNANSGSADSATFASSAASGASGVSHSATSATSQSSPGSRSSAPTNESSSKSDNSASPSGASPGQGPGPRMLDRENFEFDRMSAALSLKKLKRDRAPAPLRIPGHAGGVSPAINSAPMRTYYSGIPSYTGYSVPIGFLGRNHGGHGPIGNFGVASSLNLASAGYFQPRRMPVRQFVQPGPYPMLVVQTPLRRNIPSAYERKPIRPRGKDRRKPVQDVFLGDVKREAPMTSQPPSAQQEYFDNHEDDRTDATDEEMREMESKRLANALVEGTISFDEQSAFNFKIFGERDHDAKSKFMKMCETTWDQYMTRQT